MSKEEDALLPCPADRLNGRHWARMELRAIGYLLKCVCVCVREGASVAFLCACTSVPALSWGRYIHFCVWTRRNMSNTQLRSRLATHGSI